MSNGWVTSSHLVREKLGVLPAVVIERHPFDETNVKLLVAGEINKVRQFVCVDTVHYDAVDLQPATIRKNASQVGCCQTGLQKNVAKHSRCESNEIQLDHTARSHRQNWGSGTKFGASPNHAHIASISLTFLHTHEPALHPMKPKLFQGPFYG